MKNLIICAVVVVLSACTTPMQSGSTCVVEDEYFQAHRSIAWSDDYARISQDPLDAIAPVTLEQIRMEIQAQFTEIGFDFVADAADAEMLVSFVVATRQEISTGAYAYPDGYWWGVYRDPVVVVQSTTTERREAYLAIDLTEARSERPLWRGWAQQPVYDANRNNPAPLIKKAVTSILTELPGAARPAS